MTIYAIVHAKIITAKVWFLSRLLEFRMEILNHNCSCYKIVHIVNKHFHAHCVPSLLYDCLLMSAFHVIPWVLFTGIGKIGLCIYTFRIFFQHQIHKSFQTLSYVFSKAQCATFLPLFCFFTHFALVTVLLALAYI